MAQHQTRGQHFSVEGRSITLFGLDGSHSGSNWAIGIALSSSEDTSYLLVEVDPAPARQDILQVIEQDKAAGNLDKICHVVMSSRVAVRLFLDGTLSASNFVNAEEDTIDTSTFLKDGVMRPAIRLLDVKFGEYTFDVLILSELHIGSGTFATLDESGAVV